MAKWRQVGRGVSVSKFEASSSKFRHLQELGDLGVSGLSNSFDQSPVADPVNDPKIRKKVMAHQFDARRERLATLQRLRELSLTDFNMIGGVSPIGSMGGAGGGGDGYRPVSMGNRT